MVIEDRSSLDEPYRFLTLRLAEYDPVRAAEIERGFTLTEIAEAAAVKKHDNWIDTSDL